MTQDASLIPAIPAEELERLRGEVPPVQPFFAALRGVRFEEGSLSRGTAGPLLLVMLEALEIDVEYERDPWGPGPGAVHRATWLSLSSLLRPGGLGQDWQALFFGWQMVVGAVWHPKIHCEFFGVADALDETSRRGRIESRLRIYLVPHPELSATKLRELPGAVALPPSPLALPER